MKYPCFAIHNPSNTLWLFINETTSFALRDNGRRFEEFSDVSPANPEEYRLIEFATAYSILHPKKRREDDRYTKEAGRIIFKLIEQGVIKHVKLGSGFIRTISEFQESPGDFQCFEINGTHYEEDLTNTSGHDMSAGLDIVGIPDSDARKAFKKEFAKAYPKDYPCIRMDNDGALYYFANELDNFIVYSHEDAPQSVNPKLVELRPIEFKILDTYFHIDLQPLDYMDGNIFSKEAAHILIGLMQEKKLKGNLMLNKGQTCKAAIFYSGDSYLGGQIYRLPWLDEGSESTIRFDEDLRGSDGESLVGIRCLLDNDDHRTFLHRFALRYHKEE
jgi:hypothetical protein|nr:MAG TPA: hypothetical protein [Caudoviricetes sp.]